MPNFDYDLMIKPLIGLAFFVLGILFRPWLERNIVYKWILPPLEIHTDAPQGKWPNHRSFDAGRPIKSYFALVNKSNETIVVKDIDFSEKSKIDKGEVRWVYCITDNEKEIKSFITGNKKWVRKIKAHWGGKTSNLIPILIEPNKSAKVYVHIEPVVINGGKPNKITADIILTFKTSKRKEKIKFSRIIWEDMSKFEFKLPAYSFVSKNRQTKKVRRNKA